MMWMEWDQLFNPKTFDMKEEHYMVTDGGENGPGSQSFLGQKSETC
ncbi:MULTISPECIES: hypothetical protein [Brevibacillus]|nr:hypothetical protein [Brevibacillus borstelensis]WNF04444.1 hypothetical protein RFB14_18815 [Brevibacillus borstelensis]